MRDATLEITSLGEPAFVLGKTPPVKPRPYVRFHENVTGGAPMTVGRENPTSASSEAPGHSGRAVNDGNPETFWQSAVGGRDEWIMVDLERVVLFRQTKLLFPSEGNWRYKIEVADARDGGWRLFTDQTETASTTKARMDEAPGNSISGRFLRVTITGTPTGWLAALSEIEATGIPLP